MKNILIILSLFFVFASCTSNDPAADMSSMKGQVVSETYSCYYYTTLNGMGTDIQAEYESKGYVLEPQESPIQKTCNVYLPPGYDETQDYDVIFVLHGVGGNENNDWLSGRPSPVDIMDELILSGEIEPVIAVFPNGRSSTTFMDTSFGNQAGFYFFANELSNDLLPFIQSKYSIRSDRDSHALCGLSMGGMQTINVGLSQSLEEFAWFGAFSAAPTSYPSSTVAEYIDSQNQDASFPISFFYNLCGTSDDIARSSHEQAIEDITDKTEFLHEGNFLYETMPGGHDYNVWHTGLENFLKICFSAEL